MNDKKDYTGRYVRCLKNNANCTTVKEGEIIKLVGRSGETYLLDKTSSGYTRMGVNLKNNPLWELLPENYSPETSLVGRWVKFLRNFGDCLNLPKGSYDLITEDEKENSCITLKKYSSCSRERFDDGDLELMPIGWSPATKVSEDAPEYVECIKLSYKNYGELGKVYKVKNWNHSDSDCMLEGTTSGSTAKERFKPSTKETYDAQQSTFEIREYLECIDNSGIDNYAVIGRIYKFSKVSGPHWGVICNIDCGVYKPGDILYFFPHQLDTSTKEKYDAQLKPSIPTHVKCVSSLMNAKVGVIYPVIDAEHCKCENDDIYIWTERQFVPSNIEEYEQQFASKSTPETKYTKGKWYTCDKWGEDYLKLDYVNDQQAYFKESIVENIHVYKKDWWSIVGYPLIEADMNIVSKLLPDEHPDKINTSSQVKEWSKGTYVVITKEYHSVKIGEVHKIHRDDDEEWVNISGSVGKACLPFKDGCKWFATFEEALAFAKSNYPKVKQKIIASNVDNLTKQEVNTVYAYVGDPLPKTKPLIEDVQSVSVNLRTKKQINKFKF